MLSETFKINAILKPVDSSNSNSFVMLQRPCVSAHGPNVAAAPLPRAALHSAASSHSTCEQTGCCKVLPSCTPCCEESDVPERVQIVRGRPPDATTWIQ